VHKVSDVRQIEVHTAELLVPGPSPFETEISVTNVGFEVLMAMTMKNAVFWDLAPYGFITTQPQPNAPPPPSQGSHSVLSEL
jgi:hypothetical protein